MTTISKMMEMAGRKHVIWLGTGAVIISAGYGLALHPEAAIEEANAQTMMVTNIGATCELASYSLDELVECISEHMPQAESDGFVPPGTSIQNDWRTLVEDLVAMDDIGDCSTITIPTSLSGIYEVFPFYDAFDDREYCVAMEVLDADDDLIVDRGWGTLIVNPTPERYLSIDISHPIEDNYTNMEGIAIFKGVGAHTFVMAGANRDANDEDSSECQEDERESDVAHSIDNLFFPTVVEIDQHFESAQLDHTAIQFHGMSDTSDNPCLDVAVYITHGLGSPAQTGDPIIALKNAVLALEPSWDDPGQQTVAIPGDTATCGKNGSDNVEGRYLNDPNEPVCDSDVSSYSRKFIHIEQDSDNDLNAYRNPMMWIQALEDVFPPIGTPPVTSTISFQQKVEPSSNYVGATDTYFDALDPNAPEEDDDELEAMGNSEAAALRWDVSSIPTGSTIDEVTITLDVSDVEDGDWGGYYVYELLRDWVDLTATWNVYDTSLAWQVAGAKGALDRAAIPAAKLVPLDEGKYTFFVNPSLVQSWVDNPSTNNGILIANENNLNPLDFYSEDRTTAASRPKLTVVYH